MAWFAGRGRARNGTVVLLAIPCVGHALILVRHAPGGLSRGTRLLALVRNGTMSSRHDRAKLHHLDPADFLRLRLKIILNAERPPLAATDHLER
ncbi:hypothetical protein ACGF5C_32120 [Micromonospora sp. NPDC047620]|uniref:hypothetical protein n=1 Tax=Micromonospora sp. NPDC047620 TaxID=3364251 RepID=UPI0037136124